MRAYLVVVGDIKAILLNLLDVKLDEVLSQRGVEPKAGGLKQLWEHRLITLTNPLGCFVQTHSPTFLPSLTFDDLT